MQGVTTSMWHCWAPRTLEGCLLKQDQQDPFMPWLWWTQNLKCQGNHTEWINLPEVTKEESEQNWKLVLLWIRGVLLYFRQLTTSCDSSLWDLMPGALFCPLGMAHGTQTWVQSEHAYTVLASCGYMGSKDWTQAAGWPRSLPSLAEPSHPGQHIFFFGLFRFLKQLTRSLLWTAIYKQCIWGSRIFWNGNLIPVSFILLYS